MMDNDRELFEKAMKIKLGDMCPSFKRYGEPAQDQYIVPDVQSAWIGYQAALSHSKERIAELEKDAERYHKLKILMHDVVADISATYFAGVD
jgi:hypothetical protein